MGTQVGMLDDVAAERLRLAEDLESLTPAQWATPSLCAGWTVHDVVAHLTLVRARACPGRSGARCEPGQHRAGVRRHGPRTGHGSGPGT